MILIENEIVFIAVPKNASQSVHFALEDSNFDIKPTFNHDALVNMLIQRDPILYQDNGHKIKVHAHYTTADIYTMLGKKPPTIFIKREYSERFVSAFNFIFNSRIPLAFPNLIETLKFVDNDWIYKNFNDDIIANIIQYDPTNTDSVNKTVFNVKFGSLEDLVQRHVISILNKYTKYKVSIDKSDATRKKNEYINFKMIDSQEIYKSGYVPKYIFDINELDKLEKFLYERYGKKLEIKKINSLDKSRVKTNIINDTKLKNWVWNKFEKHHFTKKIF